MDICVNVKKEQKAFLDWEFGVFFHFGIRTYYPKHRDWDNKEMPLDKFNPTNLDCEQWIKTIKKAGAKYAILVCKHHDGFANWPSKYTDYSVSNTPWKDGKGDVVKEFTDACHNNDIKVGLYYSPAEFGFKEKGTKDYDQYFINQITELLLNYGRVDYLWFDGCGSENHQYDTKRIINTIRALQPSILIFNMWDPDTRWVGNESGYAPLNNPYLVSSLDFSVQADKKDELQEKMFLPCECDFRLRLENWFWNDEGEHTIKSVDELMGNYYYSVGRGANFLINVGPDQSGNIPQKDTKALLDFGNELRRRFDNPISNIFTKHDNTYTAEFETPTLINHVILEEQLEDNFKGQISDFEIKIYPFSYGEPITVYLGKTIGHKAICEFKTVLTKKVEVTAATRFNNNIIGFKTYCVE